MLHVHAAVTVQGCVCSGLCKVYDVALQAFMSFQRETEAMRQHVDTILARSPYSSPERKSNPRIGDYGSKEQQLGPELKHIMDLLPPAPKTPKSVNQRLGRHISPRKAVVPKSCHWRCIDTLMKEPYWQQAVAPPNRPLEAMTASQAGQAPALSSSELSSTRSRPHYTGWASSALDLPADPLSWTLSLTELATQGSCQNNARSLLS